MMLRSTAIAFLMMTTAAYAADMDHNAMRMDHAAMQKAAPSVSVKAEKDSVKKGEEYNGSFTLRGTSGAGLSPDDLQMVHTQKIHALVIDQSLGDYHHLHPEYSGKDGVYTYNFTPASGRDYKVWLDVTPKDGSQQFVSFTLHGADPCKDTCAEKNLNDRGEFFANKATVSFDKPLKKGVESEGTITLTDAKGVPLKNLEPVMGSYAHIEGFYDDFDTVQHLHPQGAEPASNDDRGASPVTFSLTPVKTGFLKYFIQMRVNEQDIFLPMGADVQ